MMVKYIEKIAGSCHKASELVEKRTVLRLTLLERAKLKLHLSICAACTKYNIQSEIIENAIDKVTSGPTQKLSEDKKDQIVEEIKKTNKM